jgi:hypothetical protein
MIRYQFNKLWRVLGVVAAPLAKLVQRESDIPLACDIYRVTQRQWWAPSMKEMRRGLANDFLANPLPALKGGLYGYESRRWLAPDIAGVMDFSGTGSEGQFNVFDYFLVDIIGFAFAVAGTTTPVKIDFDLYPAPNAKGTITASNLDGTQGTITAPNATTAQAIGAVNWKRMSAPIQISPGNSIDVDVATACTLGSEALAFVLGFPKPEEFENLSSTVGFEVS